MSRNQVVVIGKDYADAFKSVCDLYNNGFISKNLISKIENDQVIYSADGNTTFVYDDTTDSYGVEGELKIEKTGASWFKGLRNKEDIISGDNEWIDLLTNVAKEYHRTNSYLEFNQIRKDLTEKQINYHKDIINKFTRVFYPDIPYYVSNVIKKEDCDIYGVSVIMDISLVGETQKILGKVFFKNVNGKFIPLKSFEAKEVKNQIDALMANESNKSSSEENIKDEHIIDNVLIELEKTIELGKFDQSIVYASNKDLEIIDSMLEKGPQEFVELTCQGLNVLGIFHVKMAYQYYEVMYDNTVVFKVLFDLNNDFSANCLNCKDQDCLIENNRIEFDVEEEHFTYYLDNNKELFGLDIDTLNFIKKNSNITHHGNLIKHTFGNINCEKIVCNSNVITYGNCHYCKNCPFPQIVYTDLYGVPRVTASLEFAFDKMDLVSIKDDNGNKNVGKCKICDRYFSVESIKADKCPTCRSALAANSIKDNVYSKYKFMLPLEKRIFGPHYAVEDEQMIVFNLQYHLYVFDKLSINKTGYLKSPRKKD